MLVNVLLLVLSSGFIWCRKSEPSLPDADAGLFRGSDKYDFALEIPAAATECLWHFAHQSGRFYLTFLVRGVSGDHRLFVTINSPERVLIVSKNEAVGHMMFQTQVTGFYRMCFGNHNQFGRVRVSLNFGVIYEGPRALQKGTDERDQVLNSTLASIEGSLQKLQNQVFHMWRHYNFARMTKGRDHYLLLSNLSYVDCWSASQTFVILVSGYLQLLVLKRLFNTDASRPRC